MLLILELEFRLISSQRTAFFQDTSFYYTEYCGFKIQFSAGVLTLKSGCPSEDESLLDWEDPDPLDIVYYRFGSQDITSEFYVNTAGETSRSAYTQTTKLIQVLVHVLMPIGYITQPRALSEQYHKKNTDKYHRHRLTPLGPASTEPSLIRHLRSS
jgi:hypothetical protein